MGGIIYRYLYSEDGSIVSSDGKTLFKVPDILIIVYQKELKR